MRIDPASYIGSSLNYFNFYFADYSHAGKLHKILRVKLKSLCNNGGHVYMLTHAVFLKNCHYTKSYLVT